MLNYIRDPAEIYRLSFETVRSEADLSMLPIQTHSIAVRMMHACGMTDLARDLRIDPMLPVAVENALRRRGVILVDCEMLKAAIKIRQLPQSAKVVCTLNDPAVDEQGATLSTTRSAAAVKLWLPLLEQAIVVIGNAPTALFALLELLDLGAPRPAAIIGLPVGFVGAVEAKEELTRNSRGIPSLTLLGRRGGSAMAAAAFNAIASGSPS